MSNYGFNHKSKCNGEASGKGIESEPSSLNLSLNPFNVIIADEDMETFQKLSQVKKDFNFINLSSDFAVNFVMEYEKIDVIVISKKISNLSHIIDKAKKKKISVFVIGQDLKSPLDEKELESLLIKELEARIAKKKKHRRIFWRRNTIISFFRKKSKLNDDLRSSTSPLSRHLFCLNRLKAGSLCYSLNVSGSGDDNVRSYCATNSNEGRSNKNESLKSCDKTIIAGDISGGNMPGSSTQDTFSSKSSESNDVNDKSGDVGILNANGRLNGERTLNGNTPLNSTRPDTGDVVEVLPRYETKKGYAHSKTKGDGHKVWIFSNDLGKENIKTIKQKIIVFTKAKGGVGSTLLCIFLGYIFSKLKILIVDLNFSEGGSDISYYLNIPKSPSIINFMEGYNRNAMENAVFSINDNLDILQSPPTYELSKKVELPDIYSLVDIARRKYHLIMFDLSSQISELWLGVVDLADLLIMVSDNSLGSIGRLININNKFVYQELEKILVINKWSGDGDSKLRLKKSQLEEFFNLKGLVYLEEVDFLRGRTDFSNFDFSNIRSFDNLIGKVLDILTYD